MCPDADAQPAPIGFSRPPVLCRPSSPSSRFSILSVICVLCQRISAEPSRSISTSGVTRGPHILMPSTNLVSNSNLDALLGCAFFVAIALASELLLVNWLLREVVRLYRYGIIGANLTNRKKQTHEESGIPQNLRMILLWGRSTQVRKNVYRIKGFV